MAITITDLPLPLAQRSAAGRALRSRVPRSSHSAWATPADRVDPLDVIAQTAHGRVQQLVPLRNRRIAESAFAFFRGTAALMAADLAKTPVTGIRVQLCGDAHCMNFGAYASPERRLLFDVNDFDETCAGPWEWDCKRLATSLVLAARSIRLTDVEANLAALAAAESYRTKTAELAARSALDTWYAHIDAAELVPPADPAGRQRREHIVESAHAHSMQAAVEKYTHATSYGRRFIEDPPLMYRPIGPSDGGFDVERVFATYRSTLAAHVRVLLARYRVVDHAIKVVGVGSIGTRCSLALLQADGDDFLILQIKQAGASALEAYVGEAGFGNHGERVVFGQRLMQSASDAFLGWGTSGEHDFYVRQYKDKKASVDIAAMDGYGLRDYARMCGWALAIAHARSGDAAQIAGYLGRGKGFDKALMRFATLYADQAERDFDAYAGAVHAGQIQVA